MKRKGKDSKVNVALTSLLVVFVMVLSFSIGVISGKGWSDRDYQVRRIEADSHRQQAMNDEEPEEEMTEREVELLTEKALNEARAQSPSTSPDPQETSEAKAPMGTEASSASNDTNPQAKEMSDNAMPADTMKKNPASTVADATTQNMGTEIKDQKAQVKKDRKVSSLMPKPTTPKPTKILYTVQVAAYNTKAEAERHSQKLLDKGFPAYPVETIIKGQTWYRVSIGSFKSKKQAVKYHRDLKRQAMVKNSFVQKIKRK